MCHQETYMDQRHRERAKNSLTALLSSVLPAIQSTIDLSMWTVPTPHEEPDIIAFVTRVDCDLQSFDNTILEDKSNANNDVSDSVEAQGDNNDEEVLVEPEAPLR